MKLTSRLAELAGIHAGDGHLRKTKNEIEISGSFEEQEYYDKQIIPLIKNIFNITIKGKKFYSKKTYGINFSNKEVAKTLTKLGFPRGAKSTIVRIPHHILETKKREIKRAFLRGYLDTDGSITFDKKIQNTNPFKKKYNYYPRILFSSISKQLIIDVQQLCEEEGFKCNIYTQISKKANEKTKYRIQILGVKQLNKWMKIIGTNNPTKRSRYQIWQIYGFCPPNTTYNQRKKVLKGELNPYKL